VKIALVCKKYTLGRGGLERYTVLLSRELNRLGHEVHIFANTWQEEPGMTFHHVPMFRTSPGKNLSFAFFSNQILSKMRFNVIQSMERIFYQDIFRVSDGINPVQLMQRYPNPLLRKLKSAGPRRLVLSYLENRIFLNQGCRVVMTNSELLRQHIIEHYSIDPGKIVVIYNSVNTSRFHPGVREKYRNAVRERYGIGKKEILLVFISNNFKLKGLGLILEAMKMSDKTFRLIVIGSDNEKPYLRRAAQNGLDKQVLFTGPKKDVEKYYAAGDIFVLPTAYDAFANVCLEAMACGLPVITTATNGAAELIRDGENGYILKTQHPDELAGRLASLESPAERIAMGKKGASEAICHTMEKHISELSELYERVRKQKKDVGNGN